MRQEIEQAIVVACRDLFATEAEIHLTRPDEQFGDFATNTALHLGKQLGKNPREIAQMLAERMKSDLPGVIDDVSVAGPGFLNLKLTEEALAGLAHQQPAASLAGKTVVAEYSDPNAFKELHIGHLYTSIVGDAIASLLEVAGAKVHRVNYGADVGLPIAKTMWGILRYLGGENPHKMADIPEPQRAAFMGERYSEAHQTYEDDEIAKAEIIEINKHIYQLHNDNDHDSPFAQIYWTARSWSYDYFDHFYERIGTKFEKYYPESIVSPVGLKVVQEQLQKGVFETSDGAIVFKGEPYDLHTRVFITSQGLPTYEAKEIGVSMAKWADFHYDKSVIITANEINEYMKVVLKAMEQFEPELVKRTSHLTHGMVKLVGGTKMSSRKGNIMRAVDVVDAVQASSDQSDNPEVNWQAALGAIRYAFTKQRLGPDIIFDIKESVSLQGNSGPYLQYAHARARSILAKVNLQTAELSGLEADERILLRKIGEYSEVVEQSVEELMPHHICIFLYELAQVFNRFYEHNRVINDPRQALRLQLVGLYADTLKKGLELLNISAPDRM